jgi:hypothetical protein
VGKYPNILEEPPAIFRARDDRQAQYALCGGLAVAIQGHSRATEDIDLVILKEKLEPVKQALKDCGFIIDNGWIPLPSQGVEFYRMTKIIDADWLVVDLLPVAEGSNLWKEREQHQSEQGIVWVLSKDGLIEMKSKSQREKDKVDVDALRRLKRQG